MNINKLLRCVVVTCMLVPVVGVAELPARITIFTKTATGTQHAFCNALFEEYDKAYKSTTTIKAAPGASGYIATQQWARSNEPLSLFCGGMSEFAFNSRLYSDNAVIFASSKPVTTIAVGPYVFTTGGTAPFESIAELKRVKKHIFIGTHSETQLTAAKLVFGDINTTYVNYKNAPDAIPSLLDGSLDVYLSGGSFSTLTESGRLKTIGETLSASPVSLDKEYPSLVTLSLLTMIFAQSTISDDDVLELNKRIGLIMQTDRLKAALAVYNNKFTPNTVQQTRNKVRDIISVVNIR